MVQPGGVWRHLSLACSTPGAPSWPQLLMTPMPPSAGRARRPGTSSAIFFAATWLLLVIVGSSQMFRDPGTFWHLLTGERILAHGLPHEDWLSFTFAGRPWIAHQWLAELAMALLRRAGGYDALLVAATGALALLFAWGFQRLIIATVQPRWAVLLTALAVLTGAGSFHVRPLLLSMLFFAWVFARLVDVETGRARVRDLAWLLPLFIVWVNCHGAVLGGIATFAFAAIVWLGAWAVGWRSPLRDRSQAVALAALTVGVALTPAVNPYGLELGRTWLAIAGSPAVAELIVEHGSVWRTGSWYVAPLAALYVLAYLSAGRRRWQATCVLPLIWLVLMLQRIRHAPLFAVAALLALPALLPQSHLVAWLARRRVEVCGGPTESPRLSSRLWMAPLALLLLTALTFQLGREDFSGPRRGPWPFAFRERLEAAAREVGPGAPVLNDMALGGFLAHELPGLRIFGDDRCELYGDEFLREWIRGDRAWYAEWVSRFDVRIAVAEHGTPLDAYLRATPAWRKVSVQPMAALFLRGEAAAGDGLNEQPPSRAPPSHRNPER